MIPLNSQMTSRTVRPGLITVDVNCTLELHLSSFFSRSEANVVLVAPQCTEKLSGAGPQFKVWAGQFCTSIKVYSPVSRLLNTSRRGIL